MIAEAIERIAKGSGTVAGVKKGALSFVAGIEA
jgi:hypothetical protein